MAHLQQCGIPLVGVEIDERAITVTKLVERHLPTLRRVAIVMGNEAQGLSAGQMRDCDRLVRLPQYGVGTASFNVYVAAGLVLQRIHQYQTTTDSNNRLG